MQPSTSTLLVVSFSAVWPSMALGAGAGGPSTAADAEVSLAVPGRVAIAAGNDVVLQLSREGMPVVYRSEAEVTVAERSGASAGPDSVWLAVFSSGTEGAVTLEARVDDAWSPASGPGFSTSAIRLTGSAANNHVGAGSQQPMPLETRSAPIGAGSLPARFAWTRIDQRFELAADRRGTANLQEGTYTTAVTFTIKNGENAGAEARVLVRVEIPPARKSAHRLAYAQVSGIRRR